MTFKRDAKWRDSDLPDDIYIGVDLGQANDYTAVAVIEGLVYYDHYRCVALDRWRGELYPAIVKKVEDIVNSYMLAGENVYLLVDRTGCVRPIVDEMFTHGLNPIGVTITGLGEPSCEYLNKWKSRQAWAVPKRDLITNLVLRVQNRELTLLDHLPLAPALLAEMLSMTAKINSRTGNDSYGAEKAGEHDDLVTALSLAAWWAQNRPAPAFVTTPLRC